MVQPAKSRRGNDPTAFARILFCFTALRCSLRQREVRTVLMIVPDVLTHQAFQMTSIEDDYMAEQIPVTASDPALSNAVLPRASEAGSFWPDAQCLDGTDELLIEVCGSVEDQIARRGIEGECFAQLLRDPGTVRMASNFPMQNTPPVMRNDEEAVQHT